jgi:hypothetical protein
MAQGVGLECWKKKKKRQRKIRVSLPGFKNYQHLANHIPVYLLPHLLDHLEAKLRNSNISSKNTSVLYLNNVKNL